MTSGRVPVFAPDAEHRLLLAAALVPEPDRLRNVVPEPSALTWPRLSSAAAFHQLRPQLARVLQGAAAAAAAAECIRSLHECAGANRGHARMLAAGLVAVIERLRHEGIRAMPFKGPAFAARVGAGLESREVTDLDLLVAGADVAAAVRALRGLGYRARLPEIALESRWLLRANDELVLDHADRAPVELHWRLGHAWFPAPVSLPPVMARAHAEEFFGCGFDWPRAEDLFLMHVADGMKSCGGSLRWLGDLAAILRQHRAMDWSEIRAIAAQHGGLGTLRVACAALCGVVEEAARSFGAEALELEVPRAMRLLAGEAARAPRLAAQAQRLLDGLGMDRHVRGPTAHFLWALRLGDRPARVAGLIVRYAAGPAMADLQRMPSRGESGAALRWRSFRRRLARLAA